ncbi:uncharacterized protein LOC134845733 isoform X2 [Symsagittifera roscoffensis]|uniref:uncharacterized protein LOC134845733 isoform X2 n=1 Tax=Symsagittifera roscoffensis TaxID=84072 RepID=UPI00307B7351
MSIKGAWPATRAPLEERLHEMVDQVRVKYCKDSNEIVKSMDIRNIIMPPGLKTSTIVSTELAVVEIFFTVVEDSEELEVTILLFYDSVEDSCRGLLKISGELPCDLNRFMHEYVMPVPQNGSLNIWYLNEFSPIHISRFPKISSLHRRSHENFQHDLAQRNWRLWNCPELGKIGPPSNLERHPSSENEAESYCDILSVLMDERVNQNSRLSKLPIELIENIYSKLETTWTSHIETRGIFASVVAKVMFPPPCGINVNMMPITIGNSSSIPKNMKQYIPLLAACPVNFGEFGECGYLTIHESTISEEGSSQRRGGIHLETPGKIWLEGNRDPSLETSHGGVWSIQQDPPLTIGWGRGVYDDNLETHYEYIGGIYMASNIADSCRVWNCKVTDPADIVGPLGDLEHMKSVFGKGQTLDAGEMVWMTDCTPHESLPLPKGTERQYFRLVTSEVSVWYADHSTPNPLGIKPPGHVKIIHGSKFGKSPKNVLKSFKKMMKRK